MSQGRTITSRMIAALAIMILSAAAQSAMATTGPDFEQCGKASWYNLTGRTASGEQADPSGLTAAHRTLPFGTMAVVTNLANGRSVTVRINDRGPFSKGRVIDVTEAAAMQLGFIKKGITLVKVTSDTEDPKITSPQNCQ